MKKHFLVLLITSLLIACSSPVKKEPLPESQELPDEVSARPIEVFDFAGYEEKLKTLDENKTYVINFWATWCKPCVAELPYFEQLRANYHDQDVEVFLVSLDFAENLEKKVIPFVEENQLESALFLMDDMNYNSWIDKVDPNWSGAIPATVFINRSKDHYSFVEGSFTYESLEKTIQNI